MCNYLANQNHEPTGADHNLCITVLLLPFDTWYVQYITFFQLKLALKQ